MAKMKCERRGAFPSVSALFLAVLLLTAPSAGANPLTFSCTTGDVEAVRSALAGGADPNAPDESGCTPLCRTVSAGVDAPLSMHLEVIRLLVGSGAKIDAPSPGGDTPLLLSLRKGRSFTEVTELLLELGADPNGSGPTGFSGKMSDGECPLNAAAREPASVRQLELLLSRGADVRLRDGTGRSPLESAVTSPHPSVEKVRLLLDAGADVNETFSLWEEEGVTPLMAAAALGSPDLIRLLLDRGALAALSSRSGLRARDYALRAGREENAVLLP